MRSGLYKVEFRSPRGTGTGVLVVLDGQFRGGDSGFYYTGAYQISGDRITGTVLIKRHTQGIPAVVGEHATINVEGTASGDTANLSGTVVGMPGVKFQAAAQRLAD